MWFVYEWHIKGHPIKQLEPFAFKEMRIKREKSTPPQKRVNDMSLSGQFHECWPQYTFIPPGFLLFLLFFAEFSRIRLSIRCFFFFSCSKCMRTNTFEPFLLILI